MEGQDRFLKVYANLPVNLRSEIVLILPDAGPITWNVSYVEISNKTELGKKIIQGLIELKII